MLSLFRLVYTVTVKPDWSLQFADIIISELIIPYPSNHFFIPVEIGLSVLPHPNPVLFSLRSGPPFYLTVRGGIKDHVKGSAICPAPHQRTEDCASCLSNTQSISQMSHTVFLCGLSQQVSVSGISKSRAHRRANLILTLALTPASDTHSASSPHLIVTVV